jgi:hypothetical protein
VANSARVRPSKHIRTASWQTRQQVFQPGDLSSGRNLQFGRSDGQSTDWYFDGQLDDVLLFNYALTSAQIRTLHNQNAAVRFAPLTGSP